jgi:hypothetical protein
MIPKSGHRFSDKIMRKTAKNAALKVNETLRDFVQLQMQQSIHRCK